MYTILMAFDNVNIRQADLMHGDLFEQMTEVMDEYGARYVGIQMVRGNLITDEVIAESNALADEADEFGNAGINPNPMPEGMPQV